VVDSARTLGISRFIFIGGEISKYGNGWLELVRYIHTRAQPGEMTVVTLLTNGWWIDQSGFEAAGKKYLNANAYLADLQAHGVTHIQFSIDGPQPQHDQWRRHAGLYQRILEAFAMVKQAGMLPRISMVMRTDWNHEYVAALGSIAEAMYSFPKDTDPMLEINFLLNDDTNIFSNFIDIGNGADLRGNPQYDISLIPLKNIPCKAFYRPCPHFKITANGELSVCPLIDAGAGYGNITHKRFIDILNDFRNAFVYKLHAEQKLPAYLPYLDRKIFGNAFEHVCTVRTILTMLAKKMDEKQIAFHEHRKIQQINEEIALLTGHKKVASLDLL